MITRDVIRTHNEVAGKFLPEPGTYLVAWFHACFYTPGNHGNSILRPSRPPGDHVLFLTLCVSFEKCMLSKGNELDRGHRNLRKTTEHMGRPITQLSKQRKWEHGLENIALDEGPHSLSPRIRSPPCSHPRCETPDASWAFEPRSEPSLIIASENRFVLFPTNHPPGAFRVSKSVLPPSRCEQIPYFQSIENRANWVPSWVPLSHSCADFPSLVLASLGQDTAEGSSRVSCY